MASQPVSPLRKAAERRVVYATTKRRPAAIPLERAIRLARADDASAGRERPFTV